MTDGQPTIFDVLGEQGEPTTCPYCGWSWDGIGHYPVSRHIEGSNGWAFGGSENGRCENQKISLYQLGAQLHFSLRLRDDEPNTTYRTDLLGAILRAKQHGCTDKQIKAVLKAARKGVRS
jgi:hypothetical protein